MSSQLALVTGANRGIGYAICNHLVKKKVSVILGCRNLKDAEQAIDNLRKDNPNLSTNDMYADCIQLDVGNNESIVRAKQYLTDQYHNKHWPLSMLVNNAGMAAQENVFNSPLTNRICQTNFYGTMTLSQELLPLLSDSSAEQQKSQRNRILWMCSRTGNAKSIPHEQRRERLTADDLTVEELCALMDQFIADLPLMENEMLLEANPSETEAPLEVDDSFNISKEKLEKYGWWGSSYGMSKLALSQFIRVWSQSQPVLDSNVFLAGYCPGLVTTEMTARYANRKSLSASDGAAGMAFLATMDTDTSEYPSGLFWAPSFTKGENKQFVGLSNVDWKDCKLPRKAQQVSSSGD